MLTEIPFFVAHLEIESRDMFCILRLQIYRSQYDIDMYIANIESCVSRELDFYISANWRDVKTSG